MRDMYSAGVIGEFFGRQIMNFHFFFRFIFPETRFFFYMVDISKGDIYTYIFNFYMILHEIWHTLRNHIDQGFVQG